MSIIATTGSNALRAGTAGLQVVRYWTYTKYPLGEAWEANFPTTIYMVGCNPPYAVALYCTGAPTQKVLYHSNNICSTTNPGGAYVISYDRRAYCPPDLGAICEGGEEPPGGEIVVEKATVDLCITFSHNGSGCEPSLWWCDWNDFGEYVCTLSGCVEAEWWRHRTGGVIVCTQRGYNVEMYLGPFSNGAMTGNSTSGWSRSPIYISPTGAVSFGYVAGGVNDCSWNVSYSGTGSDIALDAAWNCPIGSSTIPIVAGSVYTHGNCNPSGFPRACCPGGTMCDEHEYICDAGSISITTSIKIGGSC